MCESTKTKKQRFSLLFFYFQLMIFVYAIRSTSKNYTYVGQTENVILRFHQHNDGKERITKPYAPFILIFTMACKDRVDARKLEKFYKSGEGKRILKSIKLVA